MELDLHIEISQYKPDRAFHSTKIETTPRVIIRNQSRGRLLLSGLIRIGKKIALNVY